MGIIAWIIFGLLAGAVAKLLMPGKDPGGCVVTTFLGVAGALVGGFLGSRLFNVGVTGFNFKSFLVAVAGSMLLLLTYRMIKGRDR